MTWADVVEAAQKHGLTLVLGGMVSAGTWGYRRLANRLKCQRSMELALKAGMEALLADRLIQMHTHYMERGCCPMYARRNVETMYKAYRDLGGNGAITDIYEALKRMPILQASEEREDRAHDD